MLSSILGHHLRSSSLYHSDTGYAVALRRTLTGNMCTYYMNWSTSTRHGWISIADGISTTSENSLNSGEIWLVWDIALEEALFLQSYSSSTTALK